MLAITGTPVNAAATPLGTARLSGPPPIERLVPDIDVYPQNFAMVQDAQGVGYMGNEGGVLEYDGEVWRLVALPHAEIVRSLAVAADGRVYVGSYNAFGYLHARRLTPAVAKR